MPDLVSLRIIALLVQLHDVSINGNHSRNEIWTYRFSRGNGKVVDC